MEEKISRLFSDFLVDQLGERATSVKTFLAGSMFTIPAKNCLTPGEKSHMGNEEHRMLPHDVKDIH
jgi:uncharacterized protein YbcI